ncbi:hypothetical protein M8J76_013542 [Diaphorina citri]|nr:hypothetical protein M8J76_013542 [Diaphorina citri]
MSTILVTSQHTAAKMYQDTLGQDTVVYRLNLQHGLELAFQGKCRYKDGPRETIKDTFTIDMVHNTMVITITNGQYSAMSLYFGHGV